MPILSLVLWTLGLLAVSATRLFMLGAETATIDNEADIIGRIFTADNSGSVSELLMMDVFSVLTGALAYKLGGHLFSRHLSVYRRMNDNLYDLQDEINEDVKSLEKMAAKPKKIFDTYNYHWKETKAEAYAEFRNTYLKMLDEFVLMNELDAETIERLRRAREEVPEDDPDINEGKATAEVIGEALIPNLHIPNANIARGGFGGWGGGGAVGGFGDWPGGGSGGGSGGWNEGGDSDFGNGGGYNPGHPLIDTPAIVKGYQPYIPQLPEGYELTYKGPGAGKPIEEVMLEAAEIASGKKPAAGQATEEPESGEQDA